MERSALISVTGGGNQALDAPWGLNGDIALCGLKIMTGIYVIEASLWSGYPSRDEPSEGGLKQEITCIGR